MRGRREFHRPRGPLGKMTNCKTLKQARCGRVWCVFRLLNANDYCTPPVGDMCPVGATARRAVTPRWRFPWSPLPRPSAPGTERPHYSSRAGAWLSCPQPHLQGRAGSLYLLSTHHCATNSGPDLLRSCERGPPPTH